MPVVIGRDILKRPLVEEAMRRQVIRVPYDVLLDKCVNRLIKFKVNALPIDDETGCPLGVVSKTDIVLAYHHGSSFDGKARSILKSPVASCDENSLLTDAIRLMFLKEVQRLFAHAADPSHIVGVLSLSGAAQMRSGSCRACMASRMIASP